VRELALGTRIQKLRHRRISCWRAAQQLRDDRVTICSRVGQQLGGALVRLSPASRGDVLVDDAGDERMVEAQRPPGFDDQGRYKRVGSRNDAVAVQPRQGGRDLQLCRRAEYG
jgi:hypothetical protein